MAHITIGRDLPNLKITLGNDFKREETLEEGELSENENAEEVPNSEATETENEKTVEIHRKFLSPLESFRKYENKGGAFITGLDLSLESISKKLEERATRFGLEDRPQKPITQTEIDALYKSLEISTENNQIISPKSKNIRLDAIHMRGVEEMSTNDIFKYFKEYGPASVEWINDYSCNVVWLDETGAARALLGLSRVLVIQKKSHLSAENLKKLESEGSKDKADTDITENDKGPEMEEVIVMSDMGSDDDEDDDDDDDKLVAFKHEKNKDADVEKMDVDIPPESSEEKKTEVDNSHVDVPVPPGHWRLGIPYEKTKTILLRFATKDDKKLPGAEKRSHYYQKYGNPNYGGLKGIISTTRKRKIMATRKKIGVQQLSGKGTNADLKPEDLDKYMPGGKKVKRIRMRMYADDEEEKITERVEKRQRSEMNRAMESKGNVNVHGRLGRIERRRRSFEASYVDEESDREEHVYNIVRSTISKPPTTKKEMPARFNVWTRLAETMAQESNEYSDPERVDRRRRITRNFFSSLSSSHDLRHKLHSSSFNASKEKFKSDNEIDLRSKLEKIRKNNKITKHRSPLIIEIENQRNSD